MERPRIDHATGIAFFTTTLGLCGVAWSACGITAVQLPESDDSTTRSRLASRCMGASEATPPAAVRQAIAAIVSLLRGEQADLSFVALDLDGVPPFERRAYEAVRAIPPGRTQTYGDIAAVLGEPGAARAVGQAMGRNPVPVIVPCHRVLATGGGLGGFSASGGVTTKLRMLGIEGADAARQGRLFDG
jgi:methylated-DNA-[protein]-cysteine S-methyltransferase